MPIWPIWQEANRQYPGKPPRLHQDEDSKMLGATELRDICEADSCREPRARLQHALVGKFAYFRTLGQTTGRQWSQVVLGQHPVAESVPGKGLGVENG